MSVLRWWFALNYDAIRTSPADDAFELVGQGVRVLSENEMLAEQGQRVHTGQSDPLNRQFAESFTAHFARAGDEVSGVRRAAEYLRSGDGRGADSKRRPGGAGRLEADATWPSAKLRLPQGAVPRQVETVINHRVINRRHIVAGVSGGVMVAPGDVLANSHGGSQQRRQLAKQRREAPAELGAEVWWWDAAK